MKNQGRLSDELTMLTTKLMMCGSKREIINLSSEFGKLIEKVIDQESVANAIKTPEKTITATIKFTKEEVAPMAKTFKKEFIANGLVARVIKRQSGKKTFLYEIRYRRNGYNISASSTNLNEAKRKFIEMTKPENLIIPRQQNHYSAQAHYYSTSPRYGNVELGQSNSFMIVAQEWLSTKRGEIDDRTYQGYKMNCEKRIFPILGERPISSIRTNDIKSIIDSAQGRVIETLHTIFKGIMFYAMANGDILYNPMQAIKFKKVARKKRRALTAEEQRIFLSRVDLPEFKNYRHLFLLQYYFGLRPWELTDARFDGDFLVALNAKHEEDGEPVYKKIPIPKLARNKFNLTTPIVCPHRTDVLNRVFKRIMNDETVTQYFLRHTFSTICQQYVRPDIVDIWMGDSSERLVGRVYTHFPDDFMLKQMENVKFEE